MRAIEEIRIQDTGAFITLKVEYQYQIDRAEPSIGMLSPVMHIHTWKLLEAFYESNFKGVPVRIDNTQKMEGKYCMDIESELNHIERMY